MLGERPGPNGFKDGNPSSENEGIKSLAKAMAVRAVDEQERGRARINEIAGIRQPLTPLIRNAFIVATSQVYTRVLEGTSLPGPLDMNVSGLFDELGDNTIEQMLQEDKQEGDQDLPRPTAPQFRSMVKKMAKSIVSMFPEAAESYSPSRLVKLVEEARKIAIEKNISPAFVFISEDLYVELVRRSKTAKELADQSLKINRKLTPSVMTDIIIDMITAMSPIIAQVTGEPIDAEDIKDIREETSKDPDFIKEVKKALLKYKRAIRIVTVEEIIRFWGEEGFDSLPDSTKAKLKTAKTSLLSTS